MTKAKAKKEAAPATKPERKAIQINTKYLRALRHIAASNDIRYFLNAVLFTADKDGKTYVATDGHKIAVFREGWPNGEEPQDLTIIIPREICVGAKLPKKQFFRGGVLKPVGEQQWMLETGNGPAQVFTPVDAKYPEWRKVIPDKCTGEAGNYQWNYLAEFNACLREALGSSRQAELLQNGETDPAIIACGTESFLGVVMPIRIGYQPAIPKWAQEYVAANIKRKAAEKIEAEKRLKSEAKEVATA